MAIQRNTIQRTLVLDAVKTLKNHPTPDMVSEYVRGRNPAVSRSTIYRNLNLLCEEGRLQRVHVPNSADHIDHNCEPHYHAVCNKCGSVFDVEINLDSELSDDSSDLCSYVSCKGLKIKGCVVLFTGICDNCSEESKI